MKNIYFRNGVQCNLIAKTAFPLPQTYLPRLWWKHVQMDRAFHQCDRTSLKMFRCLNSVNRHRHLSVLHCPQSYFHAFEATFLDLFKLQFWGSDWNNSKVIWQNVCWITYFWALQKCQLNHLLFLNMGMTHFQTFVSMWVQTQISPLLTYCFITQSHILCFNLIGTFLISFG